MNCRITHALTATSAFLVSVCLCQAQLTVTEGDSEQNIIDLIEGTGLTISNFQVTAGGTNQYGTFSYTPDGVLGLDQGLMVTSGSISDVNGANASEGTSFYNDDYTDPDIVAISPLATYDACVLEFDVVPKCDTIQIDFVFASEEYNEYVCSSFNDAFAFFVSGPGIEGPYTNGAANFAKLPDETPVSIGTVNNGSPGAFGSEGNCGSLDNAAYFVDNTGGANLEPDGFTVPLQVKGVVVPCETYHVKIVVADAGDSAWDSWVFLKSFSCPGQQVEMAANETYYYAEEGCQIGQFDFVRSGDTTIPLDVQVALAGDATYGTDYIITGENGEELGANVTFAANQDVLTFNVESFYDAVDEGDETIEVTLGWNVCTEYFEYASNFVIKDPTVTLECPEAITAPAASGLCSAAVEFGEPVAGLSCGYSLERTDGTGLNSGDSFPVGETTISWLMTSDSGLITASCSTLVTVQDLNAPAIACPSAVQANAGSACETAVTVGIPSVTDECGLASLTNDFNNTDDASGTYPVGTTTVTWTATDIYGNVSNCTQDIVVVETVPPTIECGDTQSFTADAGACEGYADVVPPTASDACGTVTLTNDHTGTSDASGTYPAGTTHVTWTATDLSGNVSTCVTVVYIDAGFECLEGITATVDAGSCDAYVENPEPSYTPPAECETIDLEDFESGLGLWNDPGSDCARTNNSSRSGSGNYSVRLRDDSGTSYTDTDPMDLSTYSEINISFHYYVHGFDDSSELFLLEYSTDNGDSYIEVEEWNLGDEFNNSTHYDESVTITGEFSTETRFRFRNDASANSDHVYIDDILIEGCGSSGSGSVGSGEPCFDENLICDCQGTQHTLGVLSWLGDGYEDDGTWAWEGNPVDFNCETWGFDCGDFSGSTGDPHDVCGGNLPPNNGCGECDEVGGGGTGSSSGSCGIVAVANDFTGTTDGSGVYPVGTTTVTWTFTDANGNEYYCYQDVTVQETEPPTIACNGTITTVVDDINCTALTGTGQPVVTENCGTYTLSNDFNDDPFANGNYPLGTTTVTWTVEDAAGNTASCSTDVEVTVDLVAEAGSNATLCSGSSVDLSASATGGESPYTYNWNNLAGSGQSPTVAPDATTTYTVTVTDGFGCVASDDVAVNVIASPEVTVTSTPPSCGEANGSISFSFDDVAGRTNIRFSLDGGTTWPNAYYTTDDIGTFTVEDLAAGTYELYTRWGNNECPVDLGTLSFDDSDDVPPVLSVTPSVTVVAGDDCQALVSIPVATATDDCPNVTITNSVTGTTDASGIYAGGTTTVFWTATDAAGNSSTAATVVYVTDETAPVIECADAVAGISNNDVEAYVNVPAPAVTDNCTTVSWLNDYNDTPDASDNYPNGSTVVTWTATDPAGNSATCQTTVTVSATGGPAGVNLGLRMWFDADNEANNAGSQAGDFEEVDEWNDQSGNNYDAEQANAFYRPELYEAEANFRPVLGFDGTDDVLPISDFAYQTTDLDQLRIFTVYRTDFSAGGSQDNMAFIDFDDSEYWSCYIRGDGALAMSYNNGVAQHYWTPEDGYNDGQLRIASFIYDNNANLDTRIRVNGADALGLDAASNGVTLGTGTTRYGFIGDGSEASGFNGSRKNKHYEGDIAEVVCYQEDLSDNLIERVETYLGIKYGLTVMHDYRNSAGDVIWEYAGGAFQNNVIGLMRDDAGSLDQRQAYSSEPDAVLRLSTDNLSTTNDGNTTALSNDNSYFIIGNDAGEMEFSYGWAFNDETHCNRLGRAWRMEAGGTENDLRLYVPDNVEATHAIVSSDAMFLENTQMIELSDAGGGLKSCDLSWNSGYLSFICEKTYVWNGSADNNWNNDSNWDGGTAPFAGANVRIPNGLTNYPVLSGDVEVGTLTLMDGMGLDFGSARIHVNCNLNNHMTTATKAGTVILQGNARQVIDGADPLFLHNVIVDKSDTAYVAHDLELSGYIQTNRGVLDMRDVHPTLTSDLSTTGAIGRIDAEADVLGDSLTLQRYYPPGAGQWRMICAPFHDLTFEDWNDDIATTGFPGSDWPNWPSSSNPWVNMYTYVESYTNGVQGHKDYGFTAPSDVSDEVNAVDGVFAYWVPDGDMLDVTGTWNRGETVFNLDYNESSWGSLHDGWNLIANPYPCAIDWDQEAGWEKHNLADAIYCLDPEAGMYYSYINGISTGNMESRVASSQAIWVQAIGSDPSLTINEEAKSTAQGVFMRSQESSIEALIRLTVEAGVWSDEVVLGYSEGATHGFDATHDARKIWSYNQDVPEVAIDLPGEADETGYLCIGMVPIPEENDIIPLYVNPKEHQALVLKNNLVDAMDDNICLILEDRDLDVWVPFNEGEEYGFEWNENSSNERFFLHLTAPMQNEVTNEACPDADDGSILVTGYGTPPYNVNVIGYSDGYSNSLTDIMEPVLVEGLAPGMYEVHVSGQDELCPVANEVVFIGSAPSDAVELTVVPPTCNTAEDGSITISPSGGYSWNFELLDDDNNTFLTLDALQSDTTLAGFGRGDYVLEGMSSCGKRYDSEVEMFNATAAGAFFAFAEGTHIHLANTPVALDGFANNVESLEWDFGDGITSYGSYFTEHTYNRAGVFNITLSVTGNGCTSTFSREVIIVETNSEMEEMSDASDDLASETDLDVYGVNGALNVQIGKAAEAAMTLRLFTVNGQLVFEHVFTEMAAGTFELQPGELTQGLYHVQCTVEEQTILTRKVLLAK